jgi:diguanylate cyclase (GGDEF)-like protein/PAS domain S-box-containing protein
MADSGQLMPHGLSKQNSDSAAGPPPFPEPAPPPARWLRLAWLRQRLRFNQRQLPLLVLLLGLALTTAVAEHTRRLGKQNHDQIERALLDDVADAIEVKLHEDINMISGVAGLFNASNDVSRAEFREYYDTLRRDDTSFAGIQGIGFARFISASRWQQLTAELRSQGFERFSIRPPGPRPLGSAILYLEPFDLRNQRAFGFDMYSEPVRRRAMDRAAQTGLPSISGRVRLVQERNNGVQSGVLIYAPIYRRGLLTPPRSPREYSDVLLGWAYSPIRVGDLVSTALGTVNNPDMLDSAVLVHDGSSASPETLIFDNQAPRDRRELTHPQYQPIEVAGRTWLVGIQLSRQLIGPSGFSSQVILVVVLGSMGATIAALLTAMLVNNHVATRQALATAEKANQERALATTVFESCPQAVVVTDDQGRVLSANQSFARITGYAGAEILGRNLNLLKSGRHDAGFYARLWQDVHERGFWQGEIWNRLRDGEIRRHELSITAVRDQQLQITQFVGMLQDITERHQAQELIRHRALHDELTGLPSRSMLLERLNAALALAEPHCGHVGLLFLDLDGFKPVNDRYGHATGDRVLRLVAQRLRGAIHAGDLVARMGGDEFVVLVPRAGEIDELHAFARKIQAVIAGCNDEFDTPIAISASIGVARSPDHGVAPGQLLAAADQAMYRSKQGEGDGIVVARRTDWCESEVMATNFGPG